MIGEILMAIALLCQNNVRETSSFQLNRADQERCQKQLAECVLSKRPKNSLANTDLSLLECLAERKLK